MGGGRGTRHTGILGRSRSGKSTLGQYFCRLFTDAGRETLVYDPSLTDEEVQLCNSKAPDAEWKCAFATNDQDVFLEVFFNSFDVVAFVDEGLESVGRYNVDMMKTTTRGSHQDGELGAGSSVYVMAHGYTDLNKTFRGQLSEFFVFVVSKESAEDLANEFDEPELRNASKLKPLEFYHIGTGEPTTKWRFDFTKMEPIALESENDKNVT